MNRSQMGTPQFGLSMTKGVKWLLIIQVAIWFFGQVVMDRVAPQFSLVEYFALKPGEVLYQGHIWQLLTYLFFHSTSGITHILFNGLMLWFFGSELEERWGLRKFLGYYFGTGVGAAVLYCIGIALYSALSGSQFQLIVPVIGASGAIFGLLLAQGILFGERIIYFFMIFPMKTKFFVMIMGFIQLASLLTTGFRGDVAYLAHLGGIASGFIYLRFWAYLSAMQKQSRFKKKSNLKLIINNEDDSKDKKPKYWN
ncbi:MAG: rhomboid family intramembrane serine protease [Pseudobdellovibrionaceae bacterium]